MMEHENDSPVSSFYGKVARNDLMETDKSSTGKGKDNFARNETQPEEFHVVDPFDDPMLVTTAFIDIHLQDADGNSALMLAATDNRLLHVKGILMMAANTRKLFEVLEMRNNEGLTAWDIAVRANNQQSAMLISQFTKDYCNKNKIRGRPFSISSHGSGLSKRAMETNEKDITFDFDNSPQTRPAPDFGLSDNQTPNAYDTLKASISTSKGPVPLLRRLSRDRMPNNIRGHPMDNLKRSKSSHSRLISGPQRTASGDSLTSSNCVVNSPYSFNPPPLTHPPDSGLGMFSKIRDLFANKKSATIDENHVFNEFGNNALNEKMKLTQNVSSLPENKEDTDLFRSSPWTSTPPSHPMHSGIRLPPLANLGHRRRTASESRRKNKFIIPENDE